MIFLNLSFFIVLYSDFAIFLQNHQIWKIAIFTYFVVFPKIFEVYECTIPHLKVLDLFFGPLACLFTLEVTVSEL